ncbi:hypothetical protein OEZ85_006395 [Tetradesmus obliquus]|uniref:Histone acetyltransferase n=1 Tax=Tetradesmus obliquus TaxID=3088 RepID=A0ABY8TUG9_TETOB|nr:hypothetical protein OEZ85_006395 [Tetradesmus obliquus]
MAHGQKSSGAGPSSAQRKDLAAAGALEFAVGTKTQCTAAFDGALHPAEVLEIRTDAAGKKQYYVHFMDCDKRLDEWVHADKLLPPNSNISRLESVPSLALGCSGELQADGQKITRRLKRRLEDTHHVPGHLDDSKDHAGPEKEHAERTKVKNVQVVEYGRYEMDTWYYSPYPEPYASCHKLYVCEYSLKYFRKKATLLRHLAKLEARHPPGDEIYRSPPPPASNPGASSNAVANPPIAVFEVDGKANKVYCQNLCLLSKLFLDHKTLYYDVDPFLFYVLCEVDADGYHTVGYFSKEKNCQDNYNLACILTLPCYQRKGYGKFLIAFAYQLSHLEGRPGTAERPLSDLGAVSFRSYWTRQVLDVLRDCRGDISVQDISDRTMMMPSDIIETLKQLNLLQYWKGSHYIAANPKVVEEYWRIYSGAGGRWLEVDLKCLHWQLLTTGPGRPK